MCQMSYGAFRTAAGPSAQRVKKGHWSAEEPTEEPQEPCAQTKYPLAMAERKRDDLAHNTAQQESAAERQ